MKTLKRIAFVIEEFALGSPAQQLLDRFLLGYPRDGEFHRLEECQICAYLAPDKATQLRQRIDAHSLLCPATLEETVGAADGVVVVPSGCGAEVNDRLIQDALSHAAPGSCCFVHGTLGSSLAAAKRHADLAAARGLPLLAGTPLAVTWRLPQVDVPDGSKLIQALIVVQGAAPKAELDALDGLLPVIERRQGGEAGVSAIRFARGDDLWQATKEGLLYFALSRSDSPQGDPVKDGRTQDLFTLGLVPKLARDPRGWLIEHRDGLRSTLLVLDGVIADCNFAVYTGGDVLSAQLYRPPKPAQHEFSRLAASIEDFFRSATPPWPVSRSLLTAGLLEAFQNASNHTGQRVETPEL